MTDVEGQENLGLGSSDKKRGMDHYGPERRISVQKGFGASKHYQHEHHSSLPNVDGLEDFEEFVLDFDDYDLLESIHTQLGSPLEPIRKLCLVVFLWGFTSSVNTAKGFQSRAFQCRESYVRLLMQS